MSIRVAPIRVVVALMVVAVNAWLLDVVAGELLIDGSVNPAKTDWKPSLSVSAGGASNRKTLDAYQEILARPVFFKSREPFVPAPPPPPSAVVAPPPVVVDPGLVLGGVMIKDGAKKAYVFSRANAGAGAWISEGQDFMGWQVKSVDRAGAKLEQQGRSIDLALYPSE